MYTSQAKLIGAADDRVLEFQADEEFFTLLAPLQSASRLQAFTGQDLFITYKKIHYYQYILLKHHKK